MSGKFIFGALYGVAVLAFYGILGHFQAPQFYDKLLCVPLLNLSVRRLDRFGEWLSLRLHPLNLVQRWGPRKLNFGHITIWTALFGAMTLTGFVGHNHPGQVSEFWRKACQDSRYNACVTWVHALRTECSENFAESCLEYGREVNQGRLLPAARLEAGEALGRACDLGLSRGCFDLNQFLHGDGVNAFSEGCEKGDNIACCWRVHFFREEACRGMKRWPLVSLRPPARTDFLAAVPGWVKPM